MTKKESSEPPYPILAPCRSLGFSDPVKWLNLGFKDLLSAPILSLGFGAVMAAMVASVLMAAWSLESLWLMFSLLCVFVFAAPIACVGLYAISAQLERAEDISLKITLRSCLRHYIGSELVFILLLLVLFLVWARASSMVSIFLPVNPESDLVQMLPYLAALVAISIFFLGIGFIASVFALPMIMHRDVDMVTAVVTSINAVLRNKLVMTQWAFMILVILLLGLATFGIVLIVALPTIGHAVWHSYLNAIDASQFPRYKLGITSE